MGVTTMTAVVMLAAVGWTGPVAAPPAQLVPPVYGYVWAYQPATASYLANSGYELSSTGGAIEVIRSGPGDYRVRFAGLAAAGGVAHAHAYGPGNTGFCNLVGWAASGSDEHLRVRCYAAAGTPADMRFVASFTNRRPTADSYGYLWANDPLAADPYEPPAGFTHDSTGGVITSQRYAQGHYLVFMDAVTEIYPVEHNDGHFHVTAQNQAAVRCEIYGPQDETPPPISVVCFDAAGEPADSRFTFTYARGVDLLGRSTVPLASALVRPYPDEPWLEGWWNAGGAPAVTYLGVGSYRVSFPGLATPFGHAVANVHGSQHHYCNVVSWYPSGGAQLVRVDCFETDTQVLDHTQFSVAFTS